MPTETTPTETTMRAFDYVRATGVSEAVAAVTADPAAAYLAGGTTQVDLMRDGVLSPGLLIDIGDLALRGITPGGASAGEGSIRVGALTTMEELAADATVRRRLPVVREALLLAASPQLRNMATIGGNLLQRTRCRYFRDVSCPCNKRQPGSGCGAIAGHHRMHAILGTSQHCIATHASDLAVALTALDAVVQVRGSRGERAIPLPEFYLIPGSTPEVETVLAHGELITAVDVPLPPAGTVSAYLKVRDRASYEFALASAAVALTVADGEIRAVRLALGGVATVPWRARAAEEVLLGAAATQETFRAAADAAVAQAAPRPGNAFKVELARRTVVRALSSVAGGPASGGGASADLRP
jgi:CO/xanthine dehydrogenase FAD-binding subunit